MISFSLMKLNNDSPVYIQIIEFVKKKIILSNILDGDELPSRRELAGVLGINPNTVQKAYKELENEGILITPNNVKSVITVNDEIKNKISSQLKSEATLKYINYMKSLNLDFKDAIALLTELWN
jgi:GntR family transcriptional regulator